MASGGVWPAEFLDGIPYPVIPLGTDAVNVSSASQLTTALANARAGQRILLAGTTSNPITYSGAFALPKVGTSTAGISVEAVNLGGAVFAPGTTWTIKDAAYVTLKGLVFPYELGSGNLVQFRGTSHHCRVTRCLFGPETIGTPGGNKATFVFASNDTEHIRIDHNEFRNKANPGNAVLADGNFDTNQAVRHFRFDHNWVHSIKPEVDNEKEPLRLGVSTMSKSFSYSVVERNVFEDCIAEPEVISIKASGVRVSGNVIHRCIGGPVYRHGTDGVMSDNYVVDGGSPAPGGGGDGGDPTPPPPVEQTLGVGGIPTPAPGPNVVLATSDTTSGLTINTGGTAQNLRIYDGQGHTVGRITINAPYVAVQNYNIRSGNQYGVVIDADNVIVQNCDIKDIRVSGDGDLNAITAFGSNIFILFNTAIDYVSGDPGDSHTDAIQTWVSSSHPGASSNWEIRGNKFVGPANPSRDNSLPSIHQCVMGEGFGRGGNSGGDGGDPNNWYIADNEFGDSWNQSIKLDGIDNVWITRNRFTGSSDKVMDVTSASSNVRFYSDNSVGIGYGSVGFTVTSGAGPATRPF